MKIIKLMSVLLVLTMIMQVSVLSTDVFDDVQINDGVYIYSLECPKDIKDYAIGSYMRFVKSVAYENHKLENSLAALGTPFTIGNSNSETQTYYFPIYIDGEMFGTFRVYQDLVQSEARDETVYTGVLSEYLKDDLNSLINSKKRSAGFTLEFNETDVCISTITNNDVATTRISNAAETYKYVNITNVLDSGVVNADVEEHRSSTPVRKYLSLSIIETQPENNTWCTAYSLAAVLRFLNNNTTSPTALQLMRLIYTSPGNLDRMGIPQAISIANTYGYSPVDAAYVTSQSVTINEIIQNKPLIINTRTPYGSGYEYHAVVLRGYDTTYNVYSIWNPTSTAYEVIDMDIRQYVAEGNTFTWIGTVFDW